MNEVLQQFKQQYLIKYWNPVIAVIAAGLISAYYFGITGTYWAVTGEFTRWGGHALEALGIDVSNWSYYKIIVILTRPLDYRKTPTNPLLFNAFYRRYPKLVERLTNRYADYNRAVEDVIRLNEQGEIFVIRPSVTLPIRRIEKDVAKVQAMYDLGVRDGQDILPALKTYLAK